MARPLRINVEDGLYHVTARGIERKVIFHGVRYYEHFLELLEEMTVRYAVLVHAFVLMRKHYHLIVQTPILYSARKRSGCTLKEIGGRVGGMNYKAISRALFRFEQRLAKDKKLATRTKKLLSKM